MRYIWILSIAAAFLFGCPPQQNQPQAQPHPPIKKADAPAPGPSYPPVASQPADQSPPLRTELSPIPPATQPAGQQAKRTYTVEKDDTFYSISRKLFGSDRRAKEIQAMNPGVDPTKLKIGQTINVPQP
ncbi:MAG: LysM peptidoglycan-binding domain-containing protein [Planctomycetes bacterium]|nr:LysM peptidoglycan-binding domain-containing protein [Planctomycetota bacterium]